MQRLLELAKIVREAFDERYGGSLCGFCCSASVQLFRLAKDNGLDGVTLGATGGHVFNLFEGQIVDVTATQFGVEDKVAVLPIDPEQRMKLRGRAPEDYDPWNRFEVASNLDGLKSIGWCSNPEQDRDIVLERVQKKNGQP